MILALCYVALIEVPFEDPVYNAKRLEFYFFTFTTEIVMYFIIIRGIASRVVWGCNTPTFDDLVGKLRFSDFYQ